MSSQRVDIVTQLLQNKNYDVISEYASIDHADKGKLIVTEYCGRSVRAYKDAEGNTRVMCPKNMDTIQEGHVANAIANGTIFDDADEVSRNAEMIEGTALPINGIINRGMDMPKHIRPMIAIVIGRMGEDGKFDTEGGRTNGINFVKDLCCKDKDINDVCDNYLEKEPDEYYGHELGHEIHAMKPEVENIRDVDYEDSISDDDTVDSYDGYDMDEIEGKESEPEDEESEDEKVDDDTEIEVEDDDVEGEEEVEECGDIDKTTTIQEALSPTDIGNLWNDCEYSLKWCVGAPATDEMISEAEQVLGYKLPEAYIQLIKGHNGGMLKKCICPTDTPTSWANDHVEINTLFGVDKSKRSIYDTEFWTSEWNYPEIGIVLADTPSAGHDMIFLDYTQCGNDGEPTVVSVDQEDNFKITKIADNFADLINKLCTLDEFEASKNTAVPAPQPTTGECGDTNVAAIRNDNGVYEEGFLSKKPKKLKPIGRDVVAYITVEMNAIHSSNDQAMLAGYTCSKIELVDFYLTCLDTQDARYIVPHNKQYLTQIKTDLENLLAQILRIRPINRTEQIWRVNYPTT